MTLDSRFPLRRSHSKMSTSSTLTGVGWRMGRVREGDGGERRNRCTPRQPSRWSTSWKVERARVRTRAPAPAPAPPKRERFLGKMASSRVGCTIWQISSLLSVAPTDSVQHCPGALWFYPRRRLIHGPRRSWWGRLAGLVWADVSKTEEIKASVAWGLSKEPCDGLVLSVSRCMVPGLISSLSDTWRGQCAVLTPEQNC